MSLLDKLSKALTPDARGNAAASRLQCHVPILRQIAHMISPDRNHVDRPKDADEAARLLNAYVDTLARESMRGGGQPGAPAQAFVAHVRTLVKRHGSHLFPCFDNAQIPPTTNELEGAFGQLKRFLRAATLGGSTANGVAQNLAPDLLKEFFDRSPAPAVETLVELKPEKFRAARAALDARERPAVKRRSAVRSLDDHLGRLIEASLET